MPACPNVREITHTIPRRPGNLCGPEDTQHQRSRAAGTPLSAHIPVITAQTRTRNAAGAAATAPLVVALADPRPGESVLDVARCTRVVSPLSAPRARPTGTVGGP